MSKKGKLRRAKVTSAAQNVAVEYVPDYEHQCVICGESPCVTGVAVDGPEKGKVVLATDMCGAHTWGEAAALDPSNW